MNSGLARLLAAHADEARALTERLADGDLSVTRWQRQMEKLIARHHTAALVLGRAEQLGTKPGDLISDRNLSKAERAIVKASVQKQLDYLDRFARSMPDEIGPRETARATMYAESMKESFWRGRTFGVDLPAYPGDGSSDCLTRCGCQWIERSDGWHWERGKDDSCDTCRSREGDWSPYEP